MGFEQTRICKECGKEFIAKSPRQFYCKDKHYRPCPICGKPVEVKKNKWQDPPRTCSVECMLKLKDATNLEKYGTVDPGNTPEMIEKRRQHNLEKYGIINAGNTPEAREKSRKTCLEKYGTINGGASEIAKEKRKNTNLMRYGVENAMQNKHIQQKSTQGLMARYGVDNARKIPGIDKKINKTNMEKYGVPWNISAKKVREKANKTMLERYGTIYPTKNKEVTTKTKQTCMERYGVTCPLQLESTLEKSREAMVKKYNVEYPGQSEELRNRAIQSNLQKHGTPYPSGYTGNISSINKNTANKLADIGIETTFELSIEKYSYDISIVDTNIVLELNPTYTHNSYWNHWKKHGTDKDYHKIKSKIATQHGYYCIQIFDWDNLNKIINSLKIVYNIDYNDCTIQNISADTALAFYVENSYTEIDFQNYETTNYGIYYKGDLISAISFAKLSKYKNDWNILGWCEKLHYKIINIENILKYHCNNWLCNEIYYTIDFSKQNVIKLLDMGFVYQSYMPQKLHWSKNKEHIISTDSVIKNETYLSDGWLPVFDCGYIILKYKG